MSKIQFYVPKLTDNNAWLDYREQYPGGYGWRYDRPLNGIVLAVNHHSVTNPTGDAKKDADTIYNIHKGNGWGGIGYNFLITSEEVLGKDGLKYAKVAYVGDIGSVRAHTPNSKGAFGLRAGYGNEYLIAACMIGQLHITQPTEAQVRSAYWLYRELITQESGRMPALAGDLNSKLTAHKDFDSTACPGDWGYQKNAIVNYQDPPLIEAREEVRVATIPFAYTQAEDPELPVDETRVDPGHDGEKQVTWRVIYTNGVETHREVVNEVVTFPAKDQITYVGTYVAPTPDPDPDPEPEPEPEHPFEKFIKWLIDFIKKILGEK